MKRKATLYKNLVNILLTFFLLLKHLKSSNNILKYTKFNLYFLKQTIVASS